MKFNDKVKNHMKTDLIYTTLSERLADVIFKLSKAETDIAIVKSKEDIVGVITTSDIYFALVKEVFEENTKRVETPIDLKIINIMRGPPTKNFMTSCQLNGPNPCIQIDENTTIKDAIRVMEKSGIHHLLVTGKNNKLVGTISSNDIIKSFGKAVPR